MTPRVSICIPNLNTLPYLPERLETIFAQTFQDWELVVFDNYSDDGAWQFLEAQANRESRMRITQAPRDGLYPNWNNCVRESRGEYVYIATSDDTMPANCLERLVNALESHPDCDLAHCKLRAIDENGQDDPLNEWWPQDSIFARSSGALIDLPHVRKAPYDGLLHLLGATVYTSITQLLVRRTLFDRIGLFDAQWGSVGDFNWVMRAGLTANTVHVPDTWGGWRLHPKQATSRAGKGSLDHARKIEAMIDDAVEQCAGFLPARVLEELATIWLPASREHRELRFQLEAAYREHPLKRRAYMMRELLKGSAAAHHHLKEKLSGEQPWFEAAPDIIRQWLEDAGCGPVLTPEDRAKTIASTAR